MPAPGSCTNATSAPPAPALAVGAFFGAVDERWQTELVTLSVVHHARPRHIDTHSHQRMFVSLLLRGGYQEWVAGQRWDYQPLTAVFHPEGLEHHDEITAPDTAFFTIEASPALLGERGRRHRGLRSVRDLSGGPVVWAMLRLLDAARLNRRDELEHEEPVTEIVGDLAGAAVPGGGPPRWLARVEDRLRDGFQDKVSLRELATVAAVHPVHLARVFRRHHQRSLRGFLQQLRVVHACRLIGEQRRPLAEAASASGFCDQSHMTHVFRAVTGLTPAAYRRVVVGR